MCLKPIEEISLKVRALNKSEDRVSNRILIHTDAAQTIGKVKVDVKDLMVDYLTVVGQKVFQNYEHEQHVIFIGWKFKFKNRLHI